MIRVSRFYCLAQKNSIQTLELYITEFLLYHRRIQKLKLLETMEEMMVLWAQKKLRLSLPVHYHSNEIWLMI
jgi:hypothetical protein